MAGITHAILHRPYTDYLEITLISVTYVPLITRKSSWLTTILLPGFYRFLLFRALDRPLSHAVPGSVSCRKT